jgi:Ala-tRNA(Pro) deacylase
MALTERLQRFLERQQLAYDVVPHPEQFTAQQVAEAAHIPGRHLAKVILVQEEGGGYAMVVLPAPCRVGLAALKAAGVGRRLALAPEAAIRRVFPDCEVGAMPPFGNLYDLPTYLDACFPRTGDFVFQAGNHQEVVRMRYDDYERVTRPVLGEYCLHAREKRVNE